MAERRRLSRLDERTKAYVLTDGREYPRKFEELNHEQTPINIRDISYCVKKTVQSLFDEMDDQITRISDWVWLDDDDFDFLEDEEEEKPKEFPYPVRKPKKTRRPIKNFLRTVFHIKRFKSDAERQREEEAINKLVEMNPDRPVQICSMETLLRHLLSHPGVTVAPCDIMKYLNVGNVRKMHRTYMDTKEVLNRSLATRGRYTRFILGNLCRVVAQLNATLRDDQERYQNLDANILEPGNIITKRKMVETTIVYANQSFKTLYGNFVTAYLKFRVLNDDSFNGLYDYLETRASNFCKLNPTQQPRIQQSTSSFL